MVRLFRWNTLFKNQISSSQQVLYYSGSMESAKAMGSRSMDMTQQEITMKEPGKSSPMQGTRNPYWRGRLGTVDLLILTSQLKNLFIFFYITRYLYKEVNCTQPSPWVSFPCQGARNVTIRNLKVVLGRVYNFKLDSFTSQQREFTAWKRALLKLKNSTQVLPGCVHMLVFTLW